VIDSIIDIASGVLFVAGSISLLIGGIGVLRMPAIYTRMHAAGITDTAGAALLTVGMMLQAPDWLIAIKLLLILIFLFFTSPTSTFALAHAAITSNVKPVLADDGDDKGADTGESSS